MFPCPPWLGTELMGACSWCRERVMTRLHMEEQEFKPSTLLLWGDSAKSPGHHYISIWTFKYAFVTVDESQLVRSINLLGNTDFRLLVCTLIKVILDKVTRGNVWMLVCSPFMSVPPHSSISYEKTSFGLNIKCYDCSPNIWCCTPTYKHTW